MDLDRKVYPKDVWNWFKGFIPYEKWMKAIKQVNVYSKKFTRKTEIRYPRYKVVGRKKVREFVDDVERPFNSNEKHFFDTGMESLDESMAELEKRLDEAFVKKEGIFNDIFDTHDDIGMRDTR